MPLAPLSSAKALNSLLRVAASHRCLLAAWPMLARPAFPPERPVTRSRRSPASASGWHDARQGWSTPCSGFPVRGAPNQNRGFFFFRRRQPWAIHNVRQGAPIGVIKNPKQRRRRPPRRPARPSYQANIVRSHGLCPRAGTRSGVEAGGRLVGHHELAGPSPPPGKGAQVVPCVRHGNQPSRLDAPRLDRRRDDAGRAELNSHSQAALGVDRPISPVPGMPWRGARWCNRPQDWTLRQAPVSSGKIASQRPRSETRRPLSADSMVWPGPGPDRAL